MRWEFNTCQALCIDSWQTSHGLSLSKDGINLLAVALWKSMHTASYWGLADTVRVDREFCTAATVAVLKQTKGSHYFCA